MPSTTLPASPATQARPWACLPVEAGSASAPFTLCDLDAQVLAEVVAVLPPTPDRPRDHPLARRLLELGFIAGEPVRVIAKAAPGGDPIAVRVGGRGGLATFALRRDEAAWIQVRLLGTAR